MCRGGSAAINASRNGSEANSRLQWKRRVFYGPEYSNDDGVPYRTEYLHEYVSGRGTVPAEYRWCHDYATKSHTLGNGVLISTVRVRCWNLSFLEIIKPSMAYHTEQPMYRLARGIGLGLPQCTCCDRVKPRVLTRAE